ncbi:MAG: ABC transporter ATP-binding protein [Spirochaetaceae bacterium]|nr:ABC transporter ATP-binding protein [Spirochaetaceae bacterium]
MSADVLRAEGLYKSFGSLRVADGVSMRLPAGRRHGLIGPNGAGKTTLFNLITGDVKADAGRVYVGGRDLSGTPPDRRARAGLARSFQRNNLFSDLAVVDNLALACALKRRIGHVFWRRAAGYPALREEAGEHAARLGLADRLGERVSSLGYGTQRQLEIGLALLQEPLVLLLDEPTAGMSPRETAAMVDLLAGLPSELALVVIEHDMDVVFGLADRITVLDYGRILIEGTPAEVRRSPEVRRRYLGAAGA